MISDLSVIFASLCLTHSDSGDMGKVVGVSLELQGLEGLRQMRALANPAMVDKAVALGVKAAGSAARTQIAKGITQRYNIPSARIKRDIAGPSYKGNAATIYASPNSPTLNQYGFKPGVRGGPQPGMGKGKGWGKPVTPGKRATVKVLRGKPAKPITNAFFNQSKGLPMQRIAKHRGKGSLRVLKGPSMARIFAGRGLFARELQQQSADAIDKSFAKAFEKVFKDAARGYGRR